MNSTFEEKVLGGVETLQTRMRELSAENDRVKTVVNEQAKQIVDLRKRSLTGAGLSAARLRGGVTATAAAALMADVLLQQQRSGVRPQSDRVVEAALDIVGVRSPSPLTTSEIPLGVHYASEVYELTDEFAVLRRKCTRVPILQGSTKIPRMGTRPAFGYIEMSGAIAEKKPTFTHATLDPKKLGGLVRLPREIDEASIVPMGQFLARYGAIEFARAEDTWGFLADGSATYGGVTGLCKVADDAGYIHTLEAGNTKPSDATLPDFRALRGLVNTAALANGAYYLSQTWEQALRSFNTALETAFVYRPDGTATLDGFPIVWTEVLQPYGTAAAAGEYLAVFGDMRFWLFGHRGSIRIEVSRDVFFDTDEIAVRFLEEIDFDYGAIDALSVLATPDA